MLASARGARNLNLGVLDIPRASIYQPRRMAKTDEENATLLNAVSKTDYDIDALVYEFFALTPAEIVLVEGDQ